MVYQKGRGSRQDIDNLFYKKVEPTGLEPVTSSMSRKRSNQLSYGSLLIFVPACNGKLK